MHFAKKSCDIKGLVANITQAIKATDLFPKSLQRWPDDFTKNRTLKRLKQRKEWSQHCVAVATDPTYEQLCPASKPNGCSWQERLTPLEKIATMKGL